MFHLQLYYCHEGKICVSVISSDVSSAGDRGAVLTTRRGADMVSHYTEGDAGPARSLLRI